MTCAVCEDNIDRDVPCVTIKAETLSPEHICETCVRGIVGLAHRD